LTISFDLNGPWRLPVGPIGTGSSGEYDTDEAKGDSPSHLKGLSPFPPLPPCKEMALPTTSLLSGI